MTYEELVDELVAALVHEGAFVDPGETPWDSFLRLSHCVHAHFEVPTTTLSPLMRRLLFALGRAAWPGRLVGAGTFVGYALAWLLRDALDPAPGPVWHEAVGLDLDPLATRLARRNSAILGFGRRLRFLRADATTWHYGPTPIDLLYIDIDDPMRGKADYDSVLEAAAPCLAHGALILAHDPCVPRFESDLARYHEAVRSRLGLRGPWVLPVDPCGLSVAVAP